VTEHPLVAHAELRRLARRLAERPGAMAETDGAPRRAAVAVVFRELPSADVTALEVLMILRAERTGDPWSGQVALPGGRQDPSDATLIDTAIRETLEETGVDLTRDAVILGTLDELRPRTPVLPPIIVTPIVAVVRHDVSLTTSDELAEAFWVPLDQFRDPMIARESTVRVRGEERVVSSYVLGPHVVWGMTERILRNLFRLLDEQ
jgi:8-oxo-dGTP pyrophosphatase MutT (NUDIX family)